MLLYRMLQTPCLCSEEVRYWECIIELVHFSAFESESETFEWILERPVV